MITDFLSRLDRVKSTGRGRWVACCPAHEDLHPSMTIRELDDGRVLVHCFAGCDVESIVSAIGLELHDLFPEDEIHIAKPMRRRVHPADALRAIAFEAGVVLIAAADLRNGALTQDTVDRVTTAVERIQAALEEAGL